MAENKFSGNKSGIGEASKVESSKVESSKAENQQPQKAQEAPKQEQPQNPGKSSVNLVAISRKIRCPMSGIVYNTNPEQAVGVVDIDSPEKAWERNQVKAGILKEV